MPDTTLSPELAQDILAALQAFAKHRDIASEGLLAGATARVCNEAHTRGLPVESMVIAIKRIFAPWHLEDAVLRESGQLALDALVSRCIHAHYDHQARTTL